MNSEATMLCACGAVTVEIGGQMFSMSEATFRDTYGHAPASDMPTMYNCNHCVNHWGTDLCACGSGESPADCDGGYSECGALMQYISEGQTHVCAASGWGA